VRKAVGILIENSKGEILFLLRDNKPTIQYPNQWDVLGGVVKAGETFEEAIKRELMEEIELDLQEFKLFKIYNWPDQTEAIFHTKLDIDINKTPLHEGQKIQYFSREKLLNMNLAFHDNEMIRDFFNH